MDAPLSRLTGASLGQPVRVLLQLSLVTLVFAGQLPKLRTEFGYRPLVGEEHASIQILDGFIERFGGGFPVQVAWSCRQSPRCETIFDPASLRMADAVSRHLASLAVIRDVRSPASSSLLVPTPDGFDVRRFVERGEPVHVITARPRDFETYQRVAFIAALSDLAILELRYYKAGNAQPSRVVRFPRASIRKSGGNPIPTRIHVANTLRGSETEVEITELEVNPEIDDRLFSVVTLRAQRQLDTVGNARERTRPNTP